jgi:hypothetical protein
MVLGPLGKSVEDLILMFRTLCNTEYYEKLNLEERNLQI